MNESLIEKYRREMMNMHLRASNVQPYEEPTKKEEEQDGTAELSNTENTEHENTEEKTEPEEKEQSFLEPSHCNVCKGKIALCSFRVENIKSSEPIEYAQIILQGNNGLFVRMLTDEKGCTCEIPLFCDEQWQISVTAQGYISVSSTKLFLTGGERITVPVQLDESLSLSDIFSEHDRSLMGV